MAEYLKIGQRVEVAGKDVQGVIAFYGPTSFATGKWIGLILDEAKGKNNGSVQGKSYFQCEENHGMFVRSPQVVPLDEHGKPIQVDMTSPEDVASKSKGRHSTSRISLASSRQSLASSRQSLMGSRQSLAGSRSHLASPVVEKSTEPPEQQQTPSQIPKRASFIETGFVETLKPQFTPGQVMSASTPNSLNVEEKLSHVQLQQELDNRNQQIKDLDEKLETLKIKRQEDKERLKDYDKQKIQLEHLLEFKSKIMESQASLQRELQKAKQEAKDAIEAKELHADEMADLADTVEMATLDKEMAEEKAETLQIELDACKEKLEEVTLDLEILKNEMQERTSGITTVKEGEENLSTFEIKQLKQQNVRLRETLVRMRDLSAHEKHSYQKLQKDIDQKNSEITELGRTKEKLSTRVEQLERQIADLQEQVDAALGAEEMVVLLGDQKLTLEDKVAKLEEEVAELEALQDMNDQLVESNTELEADLREELDMAHGATREALRDRDAALETIADRESTISKFRELVQKLQEQSQDLQRRLETETSKPISALPEILDFKKMFSETKAHTKAIDLELRRIDLQQLQQHVKYLSSYMPDTFMNRGGDHDAVLMLLLIPRLIHKSEILANQIAGKYPNIDKIDRSAIIKGHTVEQFAFRCRFSHYIYTLQTILHQYLHALNTCKPETLLKVGAVYPEISAQEKIIDGFVELVKRDQLDENIHPEALEKCVSYFNTMYPILLGLDSQQNHTVLLSDGVKALTSACEGINNDATVIRNLIEAGSGVGDVGLLMQHAITTSEQLLQQLKLIKRRLPPDPNVTNLGLNREVAENLYQCCLHARKVMKTLHDIAKNAVQIVVTGTDLDKGVPHDKIKDLAMNASDKVYEQDDLGPVQSVKNSLGFIVTQITQVSQFLQDNEYNITTTKGEEKPPPPIQIRARIVKKELEETKTLTSKLENKESDLKELRRVLKEKQEQLSEMTIRKELAEKKLGNVNKDYELTIEKLQRKLEEAHNNYKKKEKEFEGTLDHLQSDIDSLESEKGEMKEKLKVYTKKNVMEGMSKSTSGSQLSSLQSLGPNLPAVVRDSPLLLQEIENLRRLFCKEREARLNLENESVVRDLKNLAPLPCFKDKSDKVLDALFKEGAALKQEILMTLATPKFPPAYKAKPGNGPSAWHKHFVEENDKMLDLKVRAEEFKVRVGAEVLKRKVGGKIETDFSVFPTTQMVKALNESKPVNVGSIRIPRAGLGVQEKARVVNLEVDFDNLRKLISTLTLS